jgi:hypothetical protein
MEFGIIFWGISVESKRIFFQRKKIIRISQKNHMQSVIPEIENTDPNFSVHIVLDEIPLIQLRYFHI